MFNLFDLKKKKKKSYDLVLVNETVLLLTKIAAQTTQSISPEAGCQVDQNHGLKYFLKWENSVYVV